MKKILTILALVAGATASYGQGTVVWSSSSATYAMTTNGVTTIWGDPNTDPAPPGGWTSGRTQTGASQFYYALLFTPYGGPAPSNDPLDPVWEVNSSLANNNPVTRGGINAPGGTSAGQVVNNWGAPTGSTYDTAERNYFMLVGWSANLGTTWAAISARIAEDFGTENWVGNAYYGVSAIGNGYSGGGPFALPAPSIFGVTPGMPGGLTSGFTMNYVTAVPEPSTFALAGLGAAALVIFRRRR